MSSDFDIDLKDITNKFINSESYNLVSNYWHVLNIVNYKQLMSQGIENYSTTVAKNYNTFTKYKDENLSQSLISLNHNEVSINAEIFKQHRNFSVKESLDYNLLTLILYFKLKNMDCFKFFKQLSDLGFFGFGDPFLEVNNLKISSDKVLSILDYDKISRAFNISNFKTILELGAGSGRTTEVIITMNDSLNYVICDIPPAIYVSYKRLKKVFPEKKISLLFNHGDKKDLQSKISENDISFIFPHQLKLLERDFMDLVIAIDCLHEMDQATIKFYLEGINKISKNFYFSIWKKTKVPYSKGYFKGNNILDYEAGDYNIPDTWLETFKEDLVFPSNQLGLGYEIQN